MTYFTKTNGLCIVMYTDKSKDNFKIVNNMLYDELKNENKQIGILYNDIYNFYVIGKSVITLSITEIFLD